MAQWKRAGPITQRSEDQNLALLILLYFFYHFTSNEKYKLFPVRICDFSLASSKCNDVDYIFFFKPWITFFKLLLTWPSIITEKNVNQKYVCVLSEFWWHLLPFFVCLLDVLRHSLEN